MARETTSPYWQLRMVAEDDNRLSFHARHIFNRILSMQARKQADLDEVFPLPWPLVGTWVELKEKQCLRYLLELEERGYLFRHSVQKSPPTRFVRIVEAMISIAARKGGYKTVENGGLKTIKNDSLKPVKKDGLLICSLSDKEELKGADAPKKGTSLCSDGRDQAGGATAPPEQESGPLPPASGDPLDILRAWKKTEGHE